MKSAVSENLLILLRAALLVALIFSVALFVHYLDPANSGFCSGRSGCEAIRRSGFSYFFGKTYLNLPLLGVVAFTSTLTLSYLPMKPATRNTLLGVAAVLGGVIAVVLIGLQAWVVGAYCWLCMVVDAAAIVAAVLGVALLRKRRVEQHEGIAPWASASIALLLAVSPVLFWQFRPPAPIPPQVRSLYQPEKINVVEFADFQCPFCRTMNPVLKRLNREYGDKVNFHQLHMPLPNHAHAFKAAAAAICAEAQGQGPAMKDLLFTHSLDEEAPLRHAESLNLNIEAFEKCLSSASTSKRIYDDMDILMQSGFRGLPTTFIGEQKIVGWRNHPTLKEAYETALEGDSPFHLPSWLFWGLVTLVVCVLGCAGRLSLKRVASS